MPILSVQGRRQRALGLTGAHQLRPRHRTDSATARDVRADAAMASELKLTNAPHHSLQGYCEMGGLSFNRHIFFLRGSARAHNALPHFSLVLADLTQTSTACLRLNSRMKRGSLYRQRPLDRPSERTRAPRRCRGLCSSASTRSTWRPRPPSPRRRGRKRSARRARRRRGCDGSVGA